MFLTLLAMAATMSQTTDRGQSVEARNGEFIFRHYPVRAKALGEQGSVQFQVEVDKKGSVSSCKVIGSSGFDRLDRETCDLIVEHAQFQPTLDASGRAFAAVHTGVVNWRLQGVNAPPSRAAIGRRPLDEVMCKRSPRTGSLIGSTRVCMTREEWIAQAENSQAEFSELQGRRGFAICSLTGDDDLPFC